MRIFLAGKELVCIRKGALPCLNLATATSVTNGLARSRCAVNTCNIVLNGDISLHFFPRNAARRDKWAQLCQIKVKVSRNTQICSRHFLPSDLTTGEKMLI